MGGVQAEVDPGEVGFDAGRLARIESHFARYVDDGRLTGFQVAVARHGRVAYAVEHGRRDDAGTPVEPDTIWRIYSMTKPITSVAAMVLVEEGLLELKDPIERWLPAFADTRVYRSGSSAAPVLDPQVEPIRVWHLLTHTSGLTYGFHYAHPVDAMYRAAGFEWGVPPGLDTAAVCERWAGLPLVFQPGSEWNYGVSVDVLGHLVEVVSGQRLDRFLAERIFGPLGMVDTAFHCEEGSRHRLGDLYTPDRTTRHAVRLAGPENVATEPPPFLGGGGGLVSTTADYLRFAEMLRRGGELDGTRILGPRTLAYMTRNHLPGDADLEEFGRPLFAETTFAGVGFGLGFSVTGDPVENKVIGSAGEYGWGGAASTAFWVDPVEQLVVVFMTQLLPSSTWPIRSQLKQLVHQALVD